MQLFQGEVAGGRVVQVGHGTAAGFGIGEHRMAPYARCRQHGQQYGNGFAAAYCFRGHSDGTEMGEIVFRFQLLCLFQYDGKDGSVAGIPQCGDQGIQAAEAHAELSHAGIVPAFVPILILPDGFCQYRRRFPLA